MDKDRIALAAKNYVQAWQELKAAVADEGDSNGSNANSNNDSDTDRWLRTLTRVKDAGGTVTGKEWRATLVACGYDTRGGGGFYTGANASMRREADNSRVLTDAGKAYLAKFGEVR